MLRKAIAGGVEIKTGGRGARVIFSRYSVVDADGDVTLPGAFAGNDVVAVSAYGHTSWSGSLPTGTAAIRDTGGWAEADVSWFDTAAGRETGATVKQLADAGLGEWSYGYDILDSEPGDFGGQRVRFLKSLKVYEVSPVLVGAGVNTRTVEASSRDVGLVELRRYLEWNRRDVHAQLAAIRDRVVR